MSMSDVIQQFFGRAPMPAALTACWHIPWYPAFCGFRHKADKNWTLDIFLPRSLPACFPVFHKYPTGAGFRNNRRQLVAVHKIPTVLGGAILRDGRFRYFPAYG